MTILVAVSETAAGGTLLLEHMTVRLTATAHFTDFCPVICVKKGDLWEPGVLSQMEKATKTAKTSRKGSLFSCGSDRLLMPLHLREILN